MTTLIAWCRGGRRLLVMLTFLGLAACASPTPYTPTDDGYGYSEQQLEERRYRVSFTGNSVTERETVENYLLYRAAELTTENGYRHFQLVERNTEALTRYIGFSSGYGGLYGRDRYGSYFGSSTTDLTPITDYRATAVILFLDPGTSTDDPQIYDARDVKRQLEAGILRPG